MAARIGCDEAESERVIQALFNAFPKVKTYIKKQQDYIMEHEGRVNTLMGDRLVVPEWKFYMEAKKKGNKYEERSLESRIKRLGVNLPIQSGTSLFMSSGFMNNVIQSKEGPVRVPMAPFITVHDSNLVNFPSSFLWSLWEYYTENFMNFVYRDSGLLLKFDLNIGRTYNDMVEMKQISEDIVELTGSARSLKMIMQSMNECKGLKYQINMPVEDIKENYIEDPLQRFIHEKGCCMVYDDSKFSVQFKKLS